MDDEWSKLQSCQHIQNKLFAQLGPTQFGADDTILSCRELTDMDPEESAKIIIDHVNNGIELAKKYRLPQRIREFIPEHHGTLLTRYQLTLYFATWWWGMQDNLKKTTQTTWGSLFAWPK